MDDRTLAFIARAQARIDGVEASLATQRPRDPLTGLTWAETQELEEPAPEKPVPSAPVFEPPPEPTRAPDMTDEDVKRVIRAEFSEGGFLSDVFGEVIADERKTAQAEIEKERQRAQADNAALRTEIGSLRVRLEAMQSRLDAMESVSQAKASLERDARRIEERMDERLRIVLGKLDAYLAGEKPRDGEVLPPLPRLS